MDLSTMAKYVAGLVLMGSVFYLVTTKAVDASAYLGLVTGALSGLGIHAVANSSKQGQ